MIRIALPAPVLAALVAQTATAQSYIDQYKRAQDLNARVNSGQAGIQTRGSRASKIPRDLPKHDQDRPVRDGVVTAEQVKPAPAGDPGPITRTER